MSKAEFGGFARQAKKKGYTAFQCAAPPQQGRWGGAVTLLRKTVRHGTVVEKSRKGVQILGIWLPNVFLLNAYVAPGHQHVGAEMLGEMSCEQTLDRQEWVATGDWNQEPEDNALGPLFTAKGGRLVGASHRWTSSKRIDWAMSTVPLERLSFQGPENKRAISDHQGFWFRLQDKVQTCSCGRLKPSPTWHKPSFLSGQQWTQALSEAWDSAVEESQDYAVLRAQLDGQQQFSVQVTWDCFMSCVTVCFLKALRVLSDSNLDPDHAEEVRRLMAQNGKDAKGKPAVFQWYNVATNAGGQQNPGEAQRRVRRRLARLYEALRLAKNNGALDPALVRKLWPSWGNAVTVEAVKARAFEELRSLKQQQVEQEQQEARRRLKCWKERMCQGTFGDLGRWIRNQKQTCFGVTLYGPKGNAPDRIQAAEMIHDYWTGVWNENSIDIQEAAASLCSQFGEDRSGVQWTQLPLGALEQAVKQAKGSGGADGWDGDEIRFLPKPAVKCFHEITLRWTTAGSLPKQLLQARQVTMPKPDKIEEGNRLHVSGTRPLTVMSVWWRAYASAWVHSEQMAEWTLA